MYYLSFITHFAVCCIKIVLQAIGQAISKTVATAEILKAHMVEVGVETEGEGEIGEGVDKGTIKADMGGYDNYHVWKCSFIIENGGFSNRGFSGGRRRGGGYRGTKKSCKRTQNVDLTTTVMVDNVVVVVVTAVDLDVIVVADTVVGITVMTVIGFFYYYAFNIFYLNINRY
ncbi:hypothetical protein O6P43_026587 [Quillaja saponaria]|uniref:Uncharacterized protein n=1 Tax=Quillaja saponaria TaxID=32244 RepID=A0AAD7L3V7_QUISA|nr:hypothetical protein O6P43_026587 [Quillaja saponaria]